MPANSAKNNSSKKPKSILDEVKVKSLKTAEINNDPSKTIILDEKTIEIDKSIDEFYKNRGSKDKSNHLNVFSKDELFKKIKVVFDKSIFKLSNKQKFFSLSIIIISIVLLIAISVIVGISIVDASKSNFLI